MVGVSGRGIRGPESWLERHKAYIIGGAVGSGMISQESWLDRYKRISYGWIGIRDPDSLLDRYKRPRVMVG